LYNRINQNSIIDMKKIIGVIVALFLVYGMPSSGHASPVTTGGEALFRSNCSVCHSMQPPPKTAPPVLGIASHYRKAFSGRDEAVAHMVKFMQQPKEDASILGSQAVARFGLMPAMSMGTEELRRVAGWMWDQYNPAFTCK
jgi:mono/diheme cytochrome c family protein